MQAWLCTEGLARLCTEPHEKLTVRNAGCVMAHLTNYSLNKRSAKFVHSEDPSGDVGSKRTLSSALASLQAAGALNTALFWTKLSDLVSLTCAAIAPTLRVASALAGVAQGHCFQIFGFDVLVDADENLHLLELNASPSLNIESEITIDEAHPLPEGSRPCRGSCFTPYAHYHEVAAVDSHVKGLVLEGALSLVLGGRSDQYRHVPPPSPASDVGGVLNSLADTFLRAQRHGRLGVSAIRRIAEERNWLNAHTDWRTVELHAHKLRTAGGHTALGWDWFLALAERFELMPAPVIA